jgi:hypothetical protein
MWDLLLLAGGTSRSGGFYSNGFGAAWAEVAPTSRAPSGAGGGLQGSGDIGKLVRLVFSVWGGPLCAFCVRVVILVTSDGRLGFKSPEVSSVTAD